MEWSDIRIFLQVARDGSMVRATSVLRMDHSTISRRISRLERETGVQLFERAGRRLALTGEGEKLRTSAEQLESIILRDVLSLSADGGEIVGTVRVGATEEFGAHYLAPRLATLTLAHPGLEIELVASSRAFSLGTREVDLVIGLDRPTTGDVRCKKLIDFEVGIYGAPAYFDGRARPGDRTALAGETWCGGVAEFISNPELGAMWSAADTARARFRTTSTTAQLGAVLGGAAVAALPCYVADRQPSLERLLPADAVFHRTYWMSVHEDLARYPRVRAVMQAIDAHVQQDRTLFRPAPNALVRNDNLVTLTRDERRASPVNTTPPSAWRGPVAARG